MTVAQSGKIDLIVFIIALVFTIIIVFKLHLFEPVLKHHYNHRNKEDRIQRDTLYGIYNKKDDK